MNSQWSYSYGYGQSQYHVVLVPYKRFKMFGRTDIRKRLEQIFFSIAKRHRFQLKALEVMEEHIHLFISIRPSQSISQAIQYLKGGSSRELREVFPIMKAYHKHRLWSKGKFFRPISEVNEETIKHYIEDSQSKHHTKTHRQEAWLKKESSAKRTPQTNLLAFSS